MLQKLARFTFAGIVFRAESNKFFKLSVRGRISKDIGWLDKNKNTILAKRREGVRNRVRERPDPACALNYKRGLGFVV